METCFCTALRRALLLGLLALGYCLPVCAASTSVYIEELTSFELRERVAHGADTVLGPIGGTEQNGPHMALGKHNLRARYLAGLIAQRLGTAVVAPVIAYVPEGAIFPPVAHMRFSGTISISDETFEALLVSTAKSFKRLWGSDTHCHAYALGAYYQATQAPFIEVLRSKGFSDAEIGLHAGLADTSLMLAVDKSMVRTDLLDQGAKVGPAGGVMGDPRKSSAELGQIGIQIIVDRSVQAIRSAIAQRAAR